MAVVCVLIVISSGLVGYYLGEKFRKRKNFYNELVKFLDFIEPQISFFHTKLSDLFNEFDSKNKTFKQFLVETQAYLNNKSNNLTCLDFLTNTEREDVLRLVNVIANLDLENTSKSILSFKTLFKEKATTESLEAKTKIGLYQKLSLFLGLAIAIILI